MSTNAEENKTKFWRPFLSEPNESGSEPKTHIPQQFAPPREKENVPHFLPWSPNSDIYTGIYNGQLMKHWYRFQPMPAVGRYSVMRGCPSCPTHEMVLPVYFLNSYSAVLRSGQFHGPSSVHENYPWTEDGRKLFPSKLYQSNVTQNPMANVRHLWSSNESRSDERSSEGNLLKEQKQIQDNDCPRSLKVTEKECGVTGVDDANTCKYCHKKMTNVSSQHEKRCKVKAEGKFRCAKCDKTYSQGHTLKQHMYSHSGYKPYSCGTCLKRFADVSTRNKHQRTHTGETPYECPECNRGFTQSGNMYRHMSKIHGEVVTSEYRKKKHRKCDVIKRL